MSQRQDHIDAARERGLDPETIRVWIERGYLKGHAGVDPGRYEVDRDELDAVVAQRVDKPQA